MTLALATFHRNIFVDNLQGIHDCAVLYFSCVKNIAVVNSTFSDNKCTSLAAKSSVFHFHGMVGFYRNTGYRGGALAFHRDPYCESRQTVRIENSMILNPNTTVYIVNNTAVRYGGGILADDECTVGRYCFFQTDDLN